MNGQDSRNVLRKSPRADWRSAAHLMISDFRMSTFFSFSSQVSLQLRRHGFPRDFGVIMAKPRASTIIQRTFHLPPMPAQPGLCRQIHPSLRRNAIPPTQQDPFAPVLRQEPPILHLQSETICGCACGGRCRRGVRCQGKVKLPQDQRQVGCLLPPC